jgi:hypothetical protein
VTRLRAGPSGFRIPAGASDFSLILLFNGCRGLKVDHAPSFNADVNGIYLHSRFVPSWRGQVQSHHYFIVSLIFIFASLFMLETRRHPCSAVSIVI